MAWRKPPKGIVARLLVFYCLANCWMSWNAAKRALSLGYPNVAWYRDGTDGWLAASLPLEDAVAGATPWRITCRVWQPNVQDILILPDESSFIASWIAVAKSNSRFSISTGTSHT